MTQQYSLRWNNHQPNFISMFTSLLNSQTLVDVTLAAEGQQLKAHKLVLSACSTYFHSLFVDNPSRHPIVILKDVTFADLRTMVDFIYYGEVNVTEDQLPKVLDTAKMLKVKGLTEMPDSTSLTRAHGSMDAPRADPPPSPPSSPTARRKRRRRSSNGSTCIALEGERAEEAPTMDMCRGGGGGGAGAGVGGGGGGGGGAGGAGSGGDTVTLSSVPQQKRDYDERIENIQPATDNMNVEPLDMEANEAMAQQGWTMMEHHGYTRYTNACFGGLQQDANGALYMGGVVGGKQLGEYGGEQLGEYGAGLVGSSAGPALPAPAPEPPAPRRRRTTNPQAEQNFQRALEAVRFGGIGFCKAARLFGVNNRTLWLEYKKRGYPNTRPSIKNRIKRENNTPDLKEELQTKQEQQMLFCPPASCAPVSCPPVPVGFIESRPVDFQTIPHTSPLNILGVNFTAAMQ
ncbi:unnamed protein product [Diatraea saccharalis]|uniref:BTB domain-containing protein n=1 Tax=Diatraea saccharalis TaxID=40085 RepID=A0A9N9QTC5_9NEOP|nr:unnamed protein product [Diatraea saccharalis]